MTDMDERYDHGRLDENLDRLLKLGKPAPRMPENLKTRIRVKLIESGPQSGRKNIFSGRWVTWPVAAVTLLAVFLIVFWPGGSTNTISWADVQEKLGQIHTMTARSYKEITTAEGKRIIKRSKIYIKDPGLLKVEYFSPDADIDAPSPGPDRIFIHKLLSGRSEQLILYPNSHRAERVTQSFRTSSPEPAPSQAAINLASENWNAMKQITEDKTRRIGDRVINGKPAVGFDFYTPTKDFYIPSDESDGPAHVQIWASRDDGMPLLTEVEFRNTLGQKVRIECSDILWDVPLEENLFDFNVPAGWELSQARSELALYNKLAPGVNLQIGPEGQEPILTDEDVARVVWASQTTHPRLKIPDEMQITIELKPEAAQRLHDYAGTHPRKLIVVNFDGQIRVAAKLHTVPFTQLSFDISLLGLSLAEVEERYLTAAVERNKP